MKSMSYLNGTNITARLVQTPARSITMCNKKSLQPYLTTINTPSMSANNSNR